MVEINITINPILFIVLTIVLFALVLWIRNREFRYSKLVKIILYLLLVVDGVIIFLIICSVFSVLIATFIIIALLWIKWFFFN